MKNILIFFVFFLTFSAFLSALGSQLKCTSVGNCSGRQVTSNPSISCDLSCRSRYECEIIKLYNSSSFEANCQNNATWNTDLRCPTCLSYDVLRNSSTISKVLQAINIPFSSHFSIIFNHLPSFNFEILWKASSTDKIESSTYIMKCENNDEKSVLACSPITNQNSVDSSYNATLVSNTLVEISLNLSEVRDCPLFDECSKEVLNLYSESPCETNCTFTYLCDAEKFYNPSSTGAICQENREWNKKLVCPTCQPTYKISDVLSTAPTFSQVIGFPVKLQLNILFTQLPSFNFNILWRARNINNLKGSPVIMKCDYNVTTSILSCRNFDYEYENVICGSFHFIMASQKAANLSANLSTVDINDNNTIFDVVLQNGYYTKTIYSITLQLQECPQLDVCSDVRFLRVRYSSPTKTCGAKCERTFSCASKEYVVNATSQLCLNNANWSSFECPSCLINSTIAEEMRYSRNSAIGILSGVTLSACFVAVGFYILFNYEPCKNKSKVHGSENSSTDYPVERFFEDASSQSVLRRFFSNSSIPFFRRDKENFMNISNKSSTNWSFFKSNY